MKKRMKFSAGLLVFCMVMALVFTACGSRKDSAEGSTEDDAVYTIITDYCDLKYPEKWQSFVNAIPVEEAPYTVKFSHVDGTPLFDIVFGGASGTPLGTAESKKGSVAVSYVWYELDENNVNYYDQVGMQDAANVIVDHLKQDYALNDEAPAASVDTDDVFAVDTPFATLYYPKAWEDKVTVTTEEKTVSFSCGETRLFDIRFEKGDGAFLGMYDETPIYVVSYEVQQEGLSAEQYRDMLAMQDDLNVILENLKKDAKFE